MNMEFERRLAIPAEVKEQYPLSGSVGIIVEEKRAELRAVFEGRLDKLLLIIGPCSADNEDAVLDYMNRLVPVQEKVRDKIFMVPRIYTNKPRTTGEGYKGMLHQPDPNAKPDLYKGIVACRHSNRVAKLVKGFMIESYIEDGCQKIGEGIYGKSITDPCLGWEKTERLIYDIAEKI